MKFLPIAKQILRKLPGNSGNSGTTLCIEDPLDTSNDVGKGSFLFYRVKSAFEDAYITLQRELGTRKMFGEHFNEAVHHGNEISDGYNR